MGWSFSWQKPVCICRSFARRKVFFSKVKQSSSDNCPFPSLNPNCFNPLFEDPKYPGKNTGVRLSRLSLSIANRQQTHEIHQQFLLAEVRATFGMQGSNKDPTKWFAAVNSLKAVQIKMSDTTIDLYTMKAIISTSGKPTEYTWSTTVTIDIPYGDIYIDGEKHTAAFFLFDEATVLKVCISQKSMFADDETMPHPHWHTLNQKAPHLVVLLALFARLSWLVLVVWIRRPVNQTNKKSLYIQVTKKHHHYWTNLEFLELAIEEMHTLSEDATGLLGNNVKFAAVCLFADCDEFWPTLRPTMEFETKRHKNWRTGFCGVVISTLSSQINLTLCLKLTSFYHPVVMSIMCKTLLNWHKRFNVKKCIFFQAPWRTQRHSTETTTQIKATSTGWTPLLQWNWRESAGPWPTRSPLQNSTSCWTFSESNSRA